MRAVEALRLLSACVLALFARQALGASMRSLQATAQTIEGAYIRLAILVSVSVLLRMRVAPSLPVWTITTLQTFIAETQFDTMFTLP
jgi:hypothetical protein